MSAGRGRIRPVLGLGLAAVLVFGGCMLAGTTRGHTSLPPGRVLVVSRSIGAQDRAVAESAADLLAGGLQESTEAIRVRDFLREAGTLGALVWAPRLVALVEGGGWPTPEEAGELSTRFRVATLVTVEVTSYDQVWGKYAKFTRVGVGVTAFHVASGAVLWRLHSDAEVEDKRGRAFQYATEQAVADLVDAIDPRWRFSFVDAWRYWRR